MKHYEEYEQHDVEEEMAKLIMVCGFIVAGFGAAAILTLMLIIYG